MFWSWRMNFAQFYVDVLNIDLDLYTQKSRMHEMRKVFLLLQNVVKLGQVMPIEKYFISFLVGTELKITSNYFENNFQQLAARFQDQTIENFL